MSYYSNYLLVESPCETNYYTKTGIEVRHGINARAGKDC